MTLPPKSPDLNPVEIIKDELDIRLKVTASTSAQHFLEVLPDFCSMLNILYETSCSGVSVLCIMGVCYFVSL